MTPFSVVLGSTAAGVFAIAMILTGLRRAGDLGRAVSDLIARAPALDLIVALLTIVPGLLGALLAGTAGLGAALCGQAIALAAWVVVHELMHSDARKGPRIVKAINRIVGRPRNHLALWVSLLALPIFWAIRVGEIFVYPLLRLLLGFPAQKSGDWISVSRHKFDGLVGHDLFWCLYCDWMTGVYSLGAEMLRNIETFWCPIRFADRAKCDNCAIDFPDSANAWVPADATMGEVARHIDKYYGNGQRRWIGARTELTISAQSRTRPTNTPD